MCENSNINHKLNVLKAFACIGVVFIHVPFSGLFGQIVAAVSAYAVPIFFMIAGYYAYGKGTDVIKRRLSKIIKIFLYAYILFFSFYLIIAIQGNEVSTWFSTHFNWKTPIKYIVFCTIDFAIPLWYLIAMIEVYIFWYFIVKNKKENTILKLLPLLFIFRILLTGYCETMQMDWFWKINFVTCAMPWFLLGYYMHMDKADKLRNIDFYTVIFLIIVGCFVAVCPIIFQLSLKFSVVGYIPYALGLFMLSLKKPNNHICRPLEFIGEKLSLNIYILHILIAKLLSVICNKLLKVDLCNAISVVCLTIFTSWIFYLISEVVKNKRIVCK